MTHSVAYFGRNELFFCFGNLDRHDPPLNLTTIFRNYLGHYDSHYVRQDVFCIT